MHPCEQRQTDTQCHTQRSVLWNTHYPQPHPDTMGHPHTQHGWRRNLTHMGTQHNLHQVTHNSQQALKPTATPRHHTHDVTHAGTQQGRLPPRGTHSHPDIVHTQAQTLQSKWAQHCWTQTATPRCHTSRMMPIHSYTNTTYTKSSTATLCTDIAMINATHNISM